MACGFLLEDGTRCPEPAVKMALAPALGRNVLVPCCSDCGMDRQVSENCDD